MTATLGSNLERVPSNTNIGVLHHPNKNKLITSTAGPNRDLLIQ